MEVVTCLMPIPMDVFQSCFMPIVAFHEVLLDVYNPCFILDALQMLPRHGLLVDCPSDVSRRVRYSSGIEEDTFMIINHTIGRSS
jgi:hypothetical protein